MAGKLTLAILLLGLMYEGRAATIPDNTTTTPATICSPATCPPPPTCPPVYTCPPTEAPETCECPEVPTCPPPPVCPPRFCPLVCLLPTICPRCPPCTIVPLNYTDDDTITTDEETTITPCPATECAAQTVSCPSQPECPDVTTTPCPTCPQPDNCRSYDPCPIPICRPCLWRCPQILCPACV